MCSALVVVCCLALLGSTAAQTCSTDSTGDFSGTSKAFPSTSLNMPGSYVVPLQSGCNSKARGLQVWACARSGPPPAVTILDHQNVQVSCPYGGCVVSALGWCPFGEPVRRSLVAPSLFRPLRSELVLPVQPILGGSLGNVLFRGR